jgi:hypothetical protein
MFHNRSLSTRFAKTSKRVLEPYRQTLHILVITPLNQIFNISSAYLSILSPPSHLVNPSARFQTGEMWRTVGPN